MDMEQQAPVQTLGAQPPIPAREVHTPVNLTTADILEARELWDDAELIGDDA